MLNSTVNLNRILVMLVLSATVLATSVAAQTQDPAERQRAIDVYESQNFVKALPLLEKVALAYPNDTMILSRLGFALYAISADEKAAVKRQQMRARARTILLKSQSLGDNSNLTQMTIDVLSNPDGPQIPFSQIRTADSAMREGESAFTRGDMDKAIAAYKRALEADPTLYEAALFVGDAYFKKGMLATNPQGRNAGLDTAGIWFAKAISLNANRETAYRYWGDALEAQGRSTEALEKFVEAIVAEPYTRNPYVGLTQWAQRHAVRLGHPKIVPPNSTSTEGQNTTLNIDPRTLDSTDGSNNWLMYDLTRIAWQKADFARNYPNEKEYRHTLKEEVAALRMVAEAASKDLKSGKVKALAPGLDSLVKLNDAGLLEAFVLFARPDPGIARDYPGYRATNRDKLNRYWLQVVIAQ